MKAIRVALEIGLKRTMATAVDWPGWCRGGRDEAAALQALAAYAPRYARVMQQAGMDFQPPAEASSLAVTERLAGSATTDFGVPEKLLAGDRDAVDPAELSRMRSVLQACWQAFDGIVQQAGDRPLRKGPRGGGRESGEIVRHVTEAEQAYLGRVGWKGKIGGDLAPQEAQTLTRQAILRALEASVRGELPTQGPRGGAIWPARYFVRRVAWHVLDHAWEIEDR